MANARTDASANAVLDAEPPLYGALSSTPFNNAGGGGTEPVAGDYVRPLLTFAAASGRQRVTTAIADFISGGGNAASTVGTLQYIGLFTAASGGTLRWKGQLTVPVAWVVGSPVEIAPGNIAIAEPV